MTAPDFSTPSGLSADLKLCKAHQYGGKAFHEVAGGPSRSHAIVVSLQGHRRPIIVLDEAAWRCFVNQRHALDTVQWYTGVTLEALQALQPARAQ